MNDPGLGSMLSVNAGNSNDLYVGGGGINGGFAYALQGLQKISEYETRHNDLLNQVRSGGADFIAYSDENPTSFSLVYDNLVTKASDYYDGLCFVDIFGKGRNPHNNTMNTGMLYVAPPYGDNYRDAAGFLDAIEKTAKNIVKTVGKYNAMVDRQGVPRISVLRLCLYSSGIYNALYVSLDKIALAIFEGLRSVLENDDFGLNDIEFPCSNDINDPLFDAVKALLSV